MDVSGGERGKVLSECIEDYLKARRKVLEEGL